MAYPITQFWYASAAACFLVPSRSQVGPNCMQWLLLLVIGFALPSTLHAQEPKPSEAKQITAPKDLKLTDSATQPEPSSTDNGSPDVTSSPTAPGGLLSVSKASVLVGSLTVFLLSVFVGFEVIAKVPPTLHTPLMSGSNAISGITVVGAMLTAGSATESIDALLGSLLGLLAVVLATINVVGGFLVTHRMLMMFKKR